MEWQFQGIIDQHLEMSNHQSPASPVQVEDAHPTSQPAPKKVKRSEKGQNSSGSDLKKSGKVAVSKDSVEGLRWYVVQPSKSKPSSKPAGDATPRVWAENRSELFAVIPELTEAVNGVSWSHSQTPLLVLEGNMWPDDQWQDTTTFSLTIFRDFSCPRSILNLPKTTQTADNDVAMSISTSQPKVVEEDERRSDTNPSSSSLDVEHLKTSSDVQTHHPPLVVPSQWKDDVTSCYPTHDPDLSSNTTSSNTELCHQFSGDHHSVSLPPLVDFSAPGTSSGPIAMQSPHYPGPDFLSGEHTLTSPQMNTSANTPHISGSHLTSDYRYPLPVKSFALEASSVPTAPRGLPLICSTFRSGQSSSTYNPNAYRQQEALSPSILHVSGHHSTSDHRTPPLVYFSGPGASLVTVVSQRLPSVESSSTQSQLNAHACLQQQANIPDVSRNRNLSPTTFSEPLNSSVTTAPQRLPPTSPSFRPRRYSPGGSQRNPHAYRQESEFSPSRPHFPGRHPMPDCRYQPSADVSAPVPRSMTPAPRGSHRNYPSFRPPQDASNGSDTYHYLQQRNFRPSTPHSSEWSRPDHSRGHSSSNRHRYTDHYDSAKSRDASRMYRQTEYPRPTPWGRGTGTSYYDDAQRSKLGYPYDFEDEHGPRSKINRFPRGSSNWNTRGNRSYSDWHESSSRHQPMPTSSTNRQQYNYDQRAYDYLQAVAPSLPEGSDSSANNSYEPPTAVKGSIEGLWFTYDESLKSHPQAVKPCLLLEVSDNSASHSQFLSYESPMNVVISTASLSTVPDASITCTKMQSKDIEICDQEKPHRSAAEKNRGCGDWPELSSGYHSTPTPITNCQQFNVDQPVNDHSQAVTPSFLPEGCDNISYESNTIVDVSTVGLSNVPDASITCRETEPMDIDQEMTQRSSAEDNRGCGDWPEPSSRYHSLPTSITNHQQSNCDQSVNTHPQAVTPSIWPEVSDNSAGNSQSLSYKLPTIVEVSTASRSTVPDASVACTTTQPMDIELCEKKMPDRIPPEIQALIDSCECGIPIVVIMSRDCELIPLHLHTRYAYSYLGFFHLSTFKSKKVPLDGKRDLPDDFIQGRVQWQFTLSWSPGGEDFMDNGSLLYPWWSPYGEVSLALGNDFRRDLKKSYASYLPSQLHNDFESHRGMFPRGWRCMGCGKLNEQVLLRHRRCSNCQVAVSGYAITLTQSRDWQQQAQMSLPYDLYPDHVKTSAVIWDDGMRTFTYVIRDNAVAKHIFTCNLPFLQSEPTDLFHVIQMRVQLARQREGKTPGPYFTYVAGSESGSDSKAVAWENVPGCVTQAREFLCHRARYHGENEDIAVNRLTIMSWVTTGTKMEKVLAAESGVIILCLGADVILSLVPTGGFSSRSNIDVTGCEHGRSLTDPEMGGTETSDVAVLNSKQSSTPAQKKAESRENTLVVQMVHGDILMLNGDDFQCGLKRTGTTVFLIGSCAPRESPARML